MTKKHFIALADAIKRAPTMAADFDIGQIELLADFCAEQNPRFDRTRWLNYVAGTHGANGRKLK